MLLPNLAVSLLSASSLVLGTSSTPAQTHTHTCTHAAKQPAWLYTTKAQKQHASGQSIWSAKTLNPSSPVAWLMDHGSCQGLLVLSCTAHVCVSCNTAPTNRPGSVLVSPRRNLLLSVFCLHMTHKHLLTPLVVLRFPLQDHREKRTMGAGKFYQFMMRTRQPAGLVTNQLYLAMDDLADQVSYNATSMGNGQRTRAEIGRVVGQPAGVLSGRRCVSPMTSYTMCTLAGRSWHVMAWT